jgi:hypothetical protein
MNEGPGFRRCGKIRIEQENNPQGLKPTMITLLCAGDKSPANPKAEFFRSLFSGATRHSGW